jgi:hypothetical protein
MSRKIRGMGLVLSVRVPRREGRANIKIAEQKLLFTRITMIEGH